MRLASLVAVSALRDEARAAAMGRVWEAAGPSDGGALRRADGVLRGRFEFIGHAEERGEAPEWSGRPVSPPWTYDLHDFDYAADLARAFRRWGDPAYARRFQAPPGGWIGETSGRGPGWEPYTLPLRAEAATTDATFASVESPRTGAPAPVRAD